MNFDSSRRRKDLVAFASASNEPILPDSLGHSLANPFSLGINPDTLGEAVACTQPRGRTAARCELTGTAPLPFTHDYAPT